MNLIYKIDERYEKPPINGLDYFFHGKKVNIFDNIERVKNPVKKLALNLIGFPCVTMLFNLRVRLNKLGFIN